MKAFVHEKGKLQVKDIADPKLADDEVIIRIQAAGLNHRDLFTPKKRSADAESMVIGSDGAGVIEALGVDVDHLQVGDEVMINPSLHWYENSEAPTDEFAIFEGAFAEKVAISAEQVEKKPSFLTWEEAGVLSLSAVTGYRAMFTKGKLQEGETVFIPGAGSGVVTYLLAFAKKQGARVIVTSRSPAKREAAQKMGADVVLDSASDWAEALQNETVDLVIDSVGAATFNRSLEILKKGGRMVVFGSSTDDITDLNLRNFFYGQYQLLGSTMGSRKELRDALQFMEGYQVHPVIDRTFALDETQQAMDYLEESRQFGKLAIRMNHD